jgi:hypothetical protein
VKPCRRGHKRLAGQIASALGPGTWDTRDRWDVGPSPSAHRWPGAEPRVLPGSGRVAAVEPTCHRKSRTRRKHSEYTCMDRYHGGQRGLVFDPA